LIKDYNTGEELIPKFAQMFKRAKVHFIEAKSYMHVGRSTNRLEYSNTLEMSEVRHFAEEVAKQSGIYSVMDESSVSRIVVLQNQNRFIDRWILSHANTT
jgi:tRNA wybutosine-synthesizing protein 1